MAERETIFNKLKGHSSAGTDDDLLFAELEVILANLCAVAASNNWKVSARMFGSVLSEFIQPELHFKARRKLIEAGYLVPARKVRGETQFAVSEKAFNEKAEAPSIDETKVDEIVAIGNGPIQAPKKKRTRGPGTNGHPEGKIRDAVDDLKTF